MCANETGISVLKKGAQNWPIRRVVRPFVSERRQPVERPEEVGLDRGPRRPLAEHWRSVEGEVDACVPHVTVEDPLIDPRLIGRRGRNLGVLPLPERTEQPASVEQGPVDEAADGERLSLPPLHHLLGRDARRTHESHNRSDCEPRERRFSRSHEIPSCEKGGYRAAWGSILTRAPALR